jgi:cyclophilin family peptidyl-prolyl cis-trans isomerase
MANNAGKRARQAANRESAERDAGGGSSPRIVAVVIVLVLLVVAAVLLLVPSGDDAAQGCPPEGGSDERVTEFDGPPGICIDPDTNRYSATFETTEGSFTAELDADAAPRTVNNFVVLARYGYYDGTPIHRVVPGFVIQGGDGDGEPYGTNDLGYTIEDELPDSTEAYADYSLAMANAGPDTAGSQFFVVLPGGGSRLTPSYSYFGQVVEGTEVVDAIAELGTEGSDGPPSSEVTVESVEIEESPA